MRIVYVAAHDAGLADDEGAITHALRELGHTVYPVRERVGQRAAAHLADRPDLLLFHKWEDVNTIHQFRGVCPRAFWWFDLVDWPDPTLAGRCEQRRAWMTRVTPHVEFGFLSDGDWALRDPAKYRFLPQGADGRVAGRGEARCGNCGRGGWDVPILFTGIRRGGGQGREDFVDHMRDRYGDRFRHVERGLYREELRDAVASARFVVCPDSPVTDRYWSNRLWNAAGFGGFVLHPWCAEATRFYAPEQVKFYRDRDHLHEVINRYWDLPAEREEVRAAALGRTLKDNLYRHRCEQLLAAVAKGNP